MLATEGLAWTGIAASWGTPGLRKFEPIDPPADASAYATHSLAHLFSGLLLDTGTFQGNTIYAIAADAGPDTILDASGRLIPYAGAVAENGRISYQAIESPAQLYTTCRFTFQREEGTLMALANACSAATDFELDERIAELDFYGRENDPSIVAVPLVEELTQRARTQFEKTHPDPRFSLDDCVQSAVMKHIQRACLLVMCRNIDRLRAEHGTPTTEALLSVTGGSH